MELGECFHPNIYSRVETRVLEGGQPALDNLYGWYRTDVAAEDGGGHLCKRTRAYRAHIYLWNSRVCKNSSFLGQPETF